MRYIPRPGIVLTQVCGASLLVPNREASQFCPHIIRLSGMMALDWKALCRGEELEVIYRGHEILKRISREESVSEVDSALSMLCEKGFLIAVEDETEVGRSEA